MLFSSVLSSSHFPSLSQKSILHFCGTRGKMNTGKKHFDLTRRNGAAGTREVSKGGPERPAFGTRSCSQGLVCYTFCSARWAKGWCRLSGQHTFTRRKRRPKTAKERAAFGCCFRKGSKGEMQCCPRFRRNKRYINPPSRRSKNAFKLQACS